MSARTPIVAVLAAGAARRFGSDKLAAPLVGRAVLDWTLDAVLGAGAEVDVVVVVAALEDDRAAIAARRGVAAVLAPRAAEGLRASIDAACGAARDRDVPGLVVVLGDDPLAARALGPVLALALEDPARAVIVERRDGGAPHPVYLPVHQLPAPVAAGAPVPDHGLRALVGPGAHVHRPTDAAPTIDVDTPSDLVDLERAITEAPD